MGLVVALFHTMALNSRALIVDRGFCGCSLARGVSQPAGWTWAAFSALKKKVPDKSPEDDPPKNRSWVGPGGKIVVATPIPAATAAEKSTDVRNRYVPPPAHAGSAYSAAGTGGAPATRRVRQLGKQLSKATGDLSRAR